MLLSLSVYHSKKIAFLFIYIFLLSGLSSFAYGKSNSPEPVSRTYYYSGYGYTRDKKPVKRPADSTYKNNGPKVIRSGSKKVTGWRNDIGGPSQPEMSAFKPIGADNMVDPFTGDFSYNIPLFDVGGYPINIFYNSGITMDQEASWCGLGWNINPGTIMRNMRGLPDDFDGTDTIIKTQYTKPDQTWGVNIGGRIEVFGGALGIGLDGGIFYNNMRGLGLEAGVNPAISIGGKSGDDKTAPLSFGWKLSANSQSGGSSTFNIALKNKDKESIFGGLSASIGVHSRQGLMDLHISAETNLARLQTKSNYLNMAGNNLLNPSLSTSISFAYPSFMPSMRGRTSSQNFDLDLGFGAATWGAFSHMRLGGYYTRRWIKSEDMEITQPAYGMLYLQNGQADKNALLDFNRLNDGAYTPGTPAISVPVYTYDVFSINGEGTGGSFRAYRGDLGYMQDSYLENTGLSAHLGFEVGAGGYGHGAINANVVLTPSSSGGWDRGNLAKTPMQFRESNRDTQAVYFKNPGEKAIPNIAWQDAVGGEDLVRLKMINTGMGSPTLISSLVRYTDMLTKKDDLPLSNVASIKAARDKRTQVISFLTAAEAERVGLNKKISYVRLNEADSNQVVFGCSNANRITVNRYEKGAEAIHKLHHISEIDVLMQDGRRYIYDMPVYNIHQVDMSFNKKGSGGGNGPNNPVTNYTPGTDNEPGNNNQGKEGFVEKQETPPYAHSYLITGLLSPNYVDVKGDGITEDDMGDAIKFNYSKSDQNLKWRTPAGANTANLSEGLKTDKNDDKAHYVYGEREMWYLYSIESKNMVARFYVRNDRKDSRAVMDEDGTMDQNFGAYRLSKISLFTKGELLKRPDNPRPVKTARFEYDYSLCQNAAGSVSGYGKLTLKAIYFEYNGKDRTKKNYYRFEYPTGTGNPVYSFTANDRWGNYKPDLDEDPANGNPGNLTNTDYPYTSRNEAKTNEYAKAWSLNRIILPSGAAINVEYESDDYGFVQDRRASNMVSIAGFGTSSSPSEYSPKLYDNASSNYDYIYVTVPRAITASTPSAIKTQIKEWYLANFDKSKQVYMKLAVNMKGDQNGSGYELIPVFAEIIDYGLIPNTSGQKIYLRVKKLASNYTPMVHYALQFLKSNLPSKAYPGYDVSDQGGLKAVVKALGGLFHSFKEVFNGGMNLMIDEKHCKTTDLGKSFIRLTDPYLKKPGGGLRVKKVVLNDNWDKLTRSAPTATDGLPAATYGQEYFYTKKELVNGELMTISSGVASWEPAQGAEENPHRQAIEFYNKTPKADYDYRAMETPIPEMLYPSAMVGYSRVESRSIHRDTVKNAAGISVSEFYTTREFPTTSSFTPLSEYNAEDRFESGTLDKILKADLKTAVALSQGFKVDLNDMNGKMRKQSTYSPLNLNDPITYTESFYSMIKTGANTFKLNHSFPVINGPDGKVVQSVVGRDVEVMTDFRQHKQETITTNVNFNVDVIAGLFIPIPIPTTWKPVMKESNTYRSASVLKVVNHYSMLDSVVVVDKGSMVSTKNLVFDAETGEPLLTRTNNEHNQPIYSFSYPAHWAYSGMGLAYKNIDVVYKDLTFRNGKLDATGNVAFNLFESGDEIMVESQQTPGPAGISPCEPSSLPKNEAKKIWAVYTGKSGSPTPQWVFMDAEGNPYTAAKVKARIIRSGKRNMFSAVLGSVVSLENPVNPSTGQIQFTDATNIIQTAAATYKDHWRVDNVLYKKDSIVTVAVNARVRKKNFYPVSNVTAFMSMETTENPQYSSNTFNSLLAYKRHQKGGFSSHSRKQINRSFLLYDYATNSLPAGANFYMAFLDLYSHVNPYAAQPLVHQGVHPNFVSNSLRVTENVRYLRKQWYSATDANNWGNTYLVTDVNSSTNTAVLGPSVTGYENYTMYNRSWLNVTGLVSENRSSILGVSNKIGFQFSLPNDNGYPGSNVVEERCFWANGVVGKTPVTPVLHYYYYVCGDIIDQNPYNNDPYDNKLITCYTHNVLASFCRSKFTQRKSVNPYVEGIWGNWRVDTSFVYYGERKESTVVDGSPVDTRKGGTIINYKSFWNLAALSTGWLARNFSAADVWTWNSAITQYNRKGYEIENKDPLGRFNAGLYGYNQQLPVAIANNSRYSEAMFDGFEDYDYQSNSCTEFCKPRRHVDMGDIQPYLVSEQKHSGKMSLKVNAGQAFTFYAPVVSQASLDKPYSMRVRIDSTSYPTTFVYPNGNGIRGKYLKYNSTFNTNTSMMQAATIAVNNILTSPNTITRTDRFINLQINASASTIQPPFSWGKFVARWDGYIQALEDGEHLFRALSNDGIRVWIDNNLVIDRWTTGELVTNGNMSLTFSKGQTYSVRVEYVDTHAGGQAILLWKNPRMANHDLIPKEVLYINQSDAAGTVTTITQWCTKLDSVNVRDNALTDTFSLVQSKKMLVSAWVKIGGNDCKCSTYVNNKIRISYTGSAVISEFTPAGSIIEGWQRYEGIFDIPAAATKIKVELMNTGPSAAAWFDDLRIHPFNANMKSFVYNPQNLRLTGELDENNYASFYEYDDEGTLIRAKKETINGVKTITETRSHLQKAVQ